MTHQRSERRVTNGGDRGKFSQFSQHQRNVLPLDAATNEGRFWGKLLASPRSLTASQRIGAFILSIPLLLLGILGLSFLFFQPREILSFNDPRHPAGALLLNIVMAVVSFVVLGASLLAGLRVLANSMRGCRSLKGQSGLRR
jgi:hypothetical protein